MEIKKKYNSNFDNSVKNEALLMINLLQINGLKD